MTPLIVYLNTQIGRANAKKPAVRFALDDELKVAQFSSI